MSDPVTKMEIEDVLSSIRRLVSSGHQDRNAAMPKAMHEDRLVLTPSLRVDEGLEPAGLDGSAHRDMPETPVAGDEMTAAHATPESNTTPEPDVAHEDEEPAVMTAERFRTTRLRPGAPVSGVEAETENDASAGERQSQDSTNGEPPLGLEAQAAEFEAAVAGRDDQWEPDGTSDDALAGRPVPPLDWHDVSEDSDQDADEDDLSAEPDWDAQDSGSVDPAEDWEDVSSHEAHGRFDETLTDNSGDDEDEPQGLSLDESMLDEDSLRDLVSEIVRQELQGALGERITRNVRKLVRREIHRALTSQDFD